MTINGANRGDKKALLWQPQQPQIPQMFRTGSPDGRVHYSRCPAATTMNEDLSPNARKKEYQAGFVTIENCAISRQPQMATVRWLTWKGVDEIQVNNLRPILASIDKQERRQTDQFAPPAPPVIRHPRTNEFNNLNFAMPCMELAYLTITTMHAFTPPDTPAKRGKLLATVAGRDLPAQQLQHSGHIKSFVHCNSAIMDRVCQINLSLSKRAGHQASHY
jgi:hypothetical protein